MPSGTQQVPFSDETTTQPKPTPKTTALSHHQFQHLYLRLHTFYIQITMKTPGVDNVSSLFPDYLIPSGNVTIISVRVPFVLYLLCLKYLEAVCMQTVSPIFSPSVTISKEKQTSHAGGFQQWAEPVTRNTISAVQIQSTADGKILVSLKKNH